MHILGNIGNSLFCLYVCLLFPHIIQSRSFLLNPIQKLPLMLYIESMNGKYVWEWHSTSTVSLVPRVLNLRWYLVITNLQVCLQLCVPKNSRLLTCQLWSNKSFWKSKTLWNGYCVTLIDNSMCSCCWIRKWCFSMFNDSFARLFLHKCGKISKNLGLQFFVCIRSIQTKFQLDYLKNVEGPKNFIMS